MKLENISFIESEEALRALHHPQLSRARDKVLTKLDKHCRQIIGLSPFCIISTQGKNGADVSPRGDPPGSVAIVDDHTLLLADRVGNNRMDCMVNLMSNPMIGMLFIVPGMNETLRINGTARVTDDVRLLEQLAVKGRVPKVGILVNINEAFLHCAKALVRSRLWDKDVQIDRDIIPSFPDILNDHVEGLTTEENERQSKIMKERGLY